MATAVISGVLGTVTLSTSTFAITSYSLDGGFNFINVAAYGGPGCDEFIQALLRTGVTLRGFITYGDANLVPTRGTEANLKITLSSTGGPGGGEISYTDRVLPGPYTLVGSYAGVNEYSLTVGHASGSAQTPAALRS